MAITAVYWADRRNDWLTIDLEESDVPGLGSFLLVGTGRDGPDGQQLPVAQYCPDKDGTHTPVGPSTYLETTPLIGTPKPGLQTEPEHVAEVTPATFIDRGAQTGPEPDA